MRNHWNGFLQQAFYTLFFSEQTHQERKKPGHANMVLLKCIPKILNTGALVPLFPHLLGVRCIYKEGLCKCKIPSWYISLQVLTNILILFNVKTQSVKGHVLLELLVPSCTPPALQKLSDFPFFSVGYSMCICQTFLWWKLEVDRVE